ncbi:permease [Citricoccus nitrophenolicus]|uniref:Permease n=1 Tax=Citricoccus nitrophenolicus TaxID=863575 RepID=A0ABV0ILE8_9MICC|nr:permease [Citricoccus sp. I39-566]WMY78735.1 permease [Citricoccus sp. I39-566]
MRNETTQPVTQPGARPVTRSGAAPDGDLGALPDRPPSGTGRRPTAGTAAVLRLFLGKLFADRQVWGLPVTAFAIVGTLALLVAGGAASFWTISGDLAGFYLILSVFALMLLVFPLVGLAGSAARLLARRRDERLSSLRLLGAGTLTVRTLAVVESVVLAAAGLLLGVVGYLVFMPLVGLIPFAGRPIGLEGMWLGTGWLFAVVGALLLMAAASSMAGLRRIEITPLGVRTRQQAATVHWVRVALAVVGLVLAQVLLNAFGAGELIVVLIMLLVGFGLPMLALHFIGPWLVGLVTRRTWRRAETAEKLVAARNVLESPQQAWRQIGGLAVTTYIGVVGGAGMGLANSVSAEGARPEDLVLIGDLQTGVLLTMLIAFVLTACSVGITQAAQVLDRAQMYRGLGRLGMTEPTMEAIRRRSVMGPLWIVLVFTLVAAVVTTLPVIGAAVLFSPASIALVAAALVLGVLLVRLGVTASRPTLRGVLAER